MTGQVQCPRCGNIATIVSGWNPICVKCGYQAQHSTQTFADAATPNFSATDSRTLAPGAVAKRPGWITFLAILYIVAGSLAFVGVLFFSTIQSSLSQHGPEGVAAANAPSTPIGLGFLSGIVCLTLGIAMLKCARWSRLGAILQQTVGILYGIYALSQNQQAQTWIQIVMRVGLALNILIIGALDSVTARRYFGAKSPIPFFFR